MKTLITRLSSMTIALFGTLLLFSCDPCANAVCNNGTCSNGTCVCEPGYEKDGSSCIGVNQAFTTSDGNVSATVVTVTSGGSTQTTNNVSYVIRASSVSPYVLTIVGFAAVTDNDISFSVSPTNYDVIVTQQAVLTTAGKTYDVSGAKVGSQIQLTILDVLTGITYTIAYTI